MQASKRSLPRLGALLALCAACALQPALPAPPAGSGFTVLHRVSLPVQEVDGIKMQELSGLAFDADERLLYAVSDRGHVFHLRLVLDAARIESLVPVRAARLSDARDTGRKFNAEGLALLNADNGVAGDTQLVVALENGPAVVRFSPLGEAIADVELPPELRDERRYRSSNKRLESIAVHPRHGFVMAPEVPLNEEPEARHTLYATDGSRWRFEARAKGSDVKAIEALPGGALLVLERMGGAKKRRAGLRRIDPGSCATGSVCATGSRPDGKALVEGNFEGMTRLSGARFLLVSDGGIERRGAADFALVEFVPGPLKE